MIGRNDPCPCGSGLKYKQCCLDRPGTASLRTRLLMALAILVLLAGAILAFFHDGDGGTRRVWSPEHGHWHEIPSGSLSRLSD